MRSEVHRSVDESKRDTSEFLIRHEKLDLRLFLLRSELLLLHEETIPDRVAELKDSLVRDGVVRDPVIIDASSCVVLDGMHRVAALKELHSRVMPICAVDYLNPNIRVGTWFRVLSGQTTPAQMEAALSQSGIKTERYSADLTSVAENPTLAVLFAGGESFRLASRDLRPHEILKAAERSARELRLSVAFETEHDAVQTLLSGKAEAIMTLPKIDKVSVREAGLAGQLLPHKVTRHIIPARPLSVNVPLQMLADEIPELEEVNRQFVSTLRARGVTLRPPGTIIEGRRYEEETFIFN